MVHLQQTQRNENSRGAINKFVWNEFTRHIHVPRLSAILHNAECSKPVPYGFVNNRRLARRAKTRDGFRSHRHEVVRS